MSAQNNFTNWIINHDSSKLFIALYIGLSVFLSIFISLFWLVAVVLVHFAFEIISNRYRKMSWLETWKESAHELKLDFVLVLFALWLAVYIDMIFGVAGIGAGARGVAQAGARFAGWQRIIRGVLLSVDDVFQVIKSVFKYKKRNANKNKKITPELSDNDEEKKGGSSRVLDIILNVVGILFILLLLFSPFITDKTIAEVFNILANDLHPFPR